VDDPWSACLDAVGDRRRDLLGFDESAEGSAEGVLGEGGGGGVVPTGRIGDGGGDPAGVEDAGASSRRSERPSISTAAFEAA
jgi:hypothetical protein